MSPENKTPPQKDFLFDTTLRESRKKFLARGVIFFKLGHIIYIS